MRICSNKASGRRSAFKLYRKRLLVTACAWLIFALCFGAVCEGDAAYDRDSLIRRLNELGFLSSTESADFDTELYYAVFNFQKANGIPASGSLDPTTSQAILSDGALSFSAYLESYSRPVETDQALGFKDSGKNVRSLQTKLSELGYYTGEIDGEYSMQTACAVALFEVVNGFEPDGYADRYVMGRLLSPSALALSGFENLGTLSSGDRGVLVKYAQRLLKSLGYFEGEITGSFGENTKNAILAFEQHNGLEPTGAWQISYAVMARNGFAMDKSKAQEAELSQTLQVGDESFQVRELKARLFELGYFTGELDELFDERARLALLAFQEANDLDMTGIADEATKSRLYAEDCIQMAAFVLEKELSSLEYGQTSYGVYLMTRRLQQLGYPLETSWTYSEAVAAAVTTFQYAQGLEISGSVDADTRRLMNSARALDYTAALPIAQEKQAQSEQAREYGEFMSAVRASVGKTYEAGMTGPDSFGIGGITYYCYGLIQIEIPPTAALQLESAQQSGALIDDLDRINGGAQLFFRDETQLYTGIVTDEHRLVYASPSQGKVIETELSQVLDNYEFAGLVVYFYAP